MKRKYRRGSERKDFLGVFGDLNSGLRIETDNMGKAPAEQITYSKGGRGGTRSEVGEKCCLIASTSPAGDMVLLLDVRH